MYLYLRRVGAGRHFDRGHGGAGLLREGRRCPRPLPVFVRPRVFCCLLFPTGLAFWRHICAG